MQSTSRSLKIRIGLFLLFLCISSLVVALSQYPRFRAHTKYLGQLITDKFEQNRWAIPARVYARPLEISFGAQVTIGDLEKELNLGGYTAVEQILAQPGTYSIKQNALEIITRPFHFQDGYQESVHCIISLSHDGTIQEIVNKSTGEILDFLRFDPITLASFLPGNLEDRIILKRQDIPDLFLSLLLAVEDRNFYNHHGIDPQGITRAMIQNFKAGKTVAGGSTLTQQLVKNHFFSNERTLKRKINEGIMSLLLEKKYSKEDILVAYCNEIFMGQDGKRAIHGFALASQYYFKRDLKNLTLDQMAMLVGMVKGPSYYSPVLHPERAQKRRNVVLRVAHDQKLIDEPTLVQSITAPIKLHEHQLSALNAFPSFNDLVQRRLLETYPKEKLTNEGLQIFTTLNPSIQLQGTEVFQSSIDNLEKEHSLNLLEGAFLISDRTTGEILAMSGGRNETTGGYNRCLDAKRQIGSLMKPVVYLTALRNGYTLNTPISDTSITVVDPTTGSEWTPKNYSGREHGRILLFQGLAGSLNLATVRLGMHLGVGSVLTTLQMLGIEGEFPPYPSLLLGSEEMTPLEILQLYQTIAGSGFYSPLRVIREVLDGHNNLIQRNGISVEQRFSNEDIWLLQFGLQQVVEQGTARGLHRLLPPTLHIAGKTGTTNNNRDSWFAGYGGDKVGIVWLGKDDNTPTSLTGASGALYVWGKIFGAIGMAPLADTPPEKIRYQTVYAPSLYDTSQNSTLIRIPYRADNSEDRLQTKDGTISRGLNQMMNSIIDIFK